MATLRIKKTPINNVDRKLARSLGKRILPAHARSRKAWALYPLPGAPEEQQSPPVFFSVMALRRALAKEYLGVRQW